MCEMLTVSERRACRVLGQVRRTQRYTSILSDEETALVTNVVSLATEYGRYGYRRITALLRADGWLVNHKRVERIWRQEGLKVPARQPKRGRLWFNVDGCGFTTAPASAYDPSIATMCGPMILSSTGRVMVGS